MTSSSGLSSSVLQQRGRIKDRRDEEREDNMLLAVRKTAGQLVWTDGLRTDTHHYTHVCRWLNEFIETKLAAERKRNKGRIPK